jgi:hypothetical protein
LPARAPDLPSSIEKSLPQPAASTPRLGSARAGETALDLANVRRDDRKVRAT